MLIHLRAIERYDFAEPGPTDGTRVSSLDEHLATVGAGAKVMTWREDATSWPVHANDTLTVQRRMVTV